MAQVIINFDNPLAAKHFAQWLDGQGEQNYWCWMDCQEEEDIPIVVCQFKYNYQDFGKQTINIDTTLKRRD